VEYATVDGDPVTILLPPGYATSGRAYPVLYLFHGAFDNYTQFTTVTDIVGFTGSLPDAHQAIVVTPDQTNLPAATDWSDGTRHQETFLVHALMPWVDEHLRTIADRAHRVVAGFSGGGLDAMALAARHPDLFVAAGSFSGFVDQLTPRGIAVVEAFTTADIALCGGSESLFGIWGDPVTNRIFWEDHDPTDLVPGLRGLSLYMAAGNGISCPDDPEPDSLEAGLVQESTVYEQTQNLDAALTAAAIPHVTDLYGCGTHIGKYIQRDLHAFWPQMVAAWGTPAPTSFDYRTADASFSVYGWSFANDPARAMEFLDVRGASASGVQLTGSGRLAVTTAPIASPNQSVLVTGATGAPQPVQADGAGRITFVVDLGPPNATPATTRTITFG